MTAADQPTDNTGKSVREEQQAERRAVFPRPKA